MQYGSVCVATTAAVKTKRATKKSNSAASNSVVQAHPFYNLDANAILDFQKEFNRLMQEQIDEAR